MRGRAISEPALQFELGDAVLRRQLAPRIMSSMPFKRIERAAWNSISSLSL
jgi:hypothetical protein